MICDEIEKRVVTFKCCSEADDYIEQVQKQTNQNLITLIN